MSKTTILGYQFIKNNGYPLSNVQPTLEEAEDVARCEEAGRFYRVEQNEFGVICLKYVYGIS